MYFITTVMMIDRDGTSPKWWNWALSGAMIVGGILLCATGVGVILGGALIGAGICLMAGGYIAESYGYDFNLGYGIGMIEGAWLGAGIAYALPAIAPFASSSFTIGGGLSLLEFGDSGAILTITGAQIIAGTAALGMVGLMMFANGKSNPHDLEKGMTGKQKGAFQRAIEEYKRIHGMRPDDNVPWSILKEIAEIIRKFGQW